MLASSGPSPFCGFNAFLRFDVINTCDNPYAQSAHFRRGVVVIIKLLAQIWLLEIKSSVTENMMARIWLLKIESCHGKMLAQIWLVKIESSVMELATQNREFRHGKMVGAHLAAQNRE